VVQVRRKKCYSFRVLKFSFTSYGELEREGRILQGGGRVIINRLKELSYRLIESWVDEE
jgi:hypothetical protein